MKFKLQKKVTYFSKLSLFLGLGQLLFKISSDPDFAVHDAWAIEIA